MREGRRLVAIMPRLVPHTAFTATANTTAVLQAERNKTLRDSACAGSVTGMQSFCFIMVAIILRKHTEVPHIVYLFIIYTCRCTREESFLSNFLLG